MAELNEDQICADFDRRVDEGVVVFNPNFRTVSFTDGGFKVEFRLLSGLARKPGVAEHQQPLSPPAVPPSPTSTSTSTPSPSASPSSGYLPGSDINVSGYEIQDLGSTHLLTFNKFSAARPHLLFLTQDGFRRQHEALDVDDLTALRRVMSAFAQRRYLAIFNCGVSAGCSRMHKHMQVFPAPEGFELWPDVSGGQATLPFKAFVHRFDAKEFPDPSALLGIYTSLLGQAEEALGSGWSSSPPDGKEKEAPPHNFVLSREWMMVVPRRAAGWKGADTNAAGVLGMLWVSDEEKMLLWMDLGPARVLAQLGVPADGTDTHLLDSVTGVPPRG